MWTAVDAVRRVSDGFISSFCRPDISPNSFSNDLGLLSPCFTDIAVLGGCHCMTIALCLLRWQDLRSRRLRHYELSGVSRGMQQVLLFIVGVISAIPVLQLQARLAQSTYALARHGIAPYEVAGYLLASISWLAVFAVYGREVSRYTPTRTWALRMPIVATFAGQLAKLRTVLYLSTQADRNYFFWLFITDTALQGLLACLALFRGPQQDDLQLVCNLQSGYESLEASDAATPVDENICPEATAGFFSLLTFAWITPLLRTGYKAPLEFKNLFTLAPYDSVRTNSQRFQQAWTEQRARAATKPPSLFWACWKTVGHLFVSAIPFKIGNDASQFVGPIFLNLLLDSMDRNAPATRSYIYACCMFGGTLAGVFCDAQHFQRVTRAGFQIRAVFIAEVFRKVLFLAPSWRATFSRGYVYNLSTSDVDTVQMFCQQLFSLFSSPVRIAVAMALLYEQLGVSSIAALVLLILAIPIQMVMVRISVRILKRSKKFSDERTKLESDLVMGIEAVKTAAWETAFIDRVLSMRNQELHLLWNGFKVAALNSMLLQTIPTLVMVVTFSIYVLLGNELTAAKAFTALALFSVLRAPLFMLPQIVNQATQASVALKRIQDFLLADEQGPLQLEAPPGGVSSNGSTDWSLAVRVRGSFRWAQDLPPVLSRIDVEVLRGQLVVIVGATGAGKSSLLSVLLGLMQPEPNQEVTLRGSVAYVSQSAFIFGGTVRDNILFYQPYDAKLYECAIEAACLGPDLDQLPARDLTELGESGINVSGGQKQRIQIARTVYARAQVLLLDDPLSALDAKVGRQVFETGIKGHLQGTTRLLVTNQLQFASSADQVLYLSHGEIAEQGTYAELMARGGGFAAMMNESQAEDSDASEASMELDKKGAPALPTSTAPNAASAAPPPPVPIASGGGAPSGVLTVAERRATGVVAIKVLAAYMRAMGGARLFFSLIFLYFLTEGLRLLSTLWLSVWTSDTHENGPGDARRGAQYYLSVFTAISAGQVISAAANQYFMRYLSVRAARSMHEGMLGSLVRAPMAFFHSNPSGRIINRLTKDTSEIDSNLAQYASMTFQTVLQLVTTAVLIGVITPFLLPLLVPVLLCFYMLYLYFQASVREVKRLDALSRSPIFSCVSDAINGLATIRSFRIEEYLIARLGVLVDGNSVMQLTNASLNRWLSIRLESLGSFVAFAAAVLAVEQGGHAGWLGLTLSYALQMTSITTMTVRLASMAENSFNAVERVDEYSQLEAEAPAVLAVPGLPQGWPTRGEIVFQRVTMRYRPGLPLVLKGLTLRIEQGSKVGVVGRTGAGKSTIINTLFRLTEPSSGKILIDNVDIGTLGLAQLRGSMALIPQVPVIFTGTLRENLDPFNQHKDEELWTALQRSHLFGAVDSQPLKLAMRLAEGGAPFSAGQRQLVALTRALLRHSKVLILDEATANVDVETDALIQKTIRTEFAGATQVAIAHRLHTVIDCDRILVMSAGEAAEYGSPADLLRNPEGTFSSIVHETGPATEAFLRSVAFGEADLSDLREEAAQAGIQQLELDGAEMQQRSMMGLSCQVVRSARETALMIERVMQFLDDQDHALELERMHREQGDVISDAEGASNADDAIAALSRAAAELASLQQVAKDAFSRLGIDVSCAAPEAHPPAEAPRAEGAFAASPPRADPTRHLQSFKSCPDGAISSLACLDRASVVSGRTRRSLVGDEPSRGLVAMRAHVTALRAASRFRALAGKTSASADLGSMEL